MVVPTPVRASRPRSEARVEPSTASLRPRSCANPEKYEPPAILRFSTSLRAVVVPFTVPCTLVEPLVTVAVACTTGATARTELSLLSCFTSVRVKVWLEPAEPRIPPPKPRPPCTVRVLAPRPLNWSLTSAAEPLPTATRLTTVSIERSALARRRLRASRTASRITGRRQRHHRHRRSHHRHRHR